MTYLVVPGVPDGAVASGIVALCARVLPANGAIDLADRLGHARDPWGIAALVGDDVVGFKLGYSDRPGRFYSWLGGVSPDFRRRGIARELLRRQHERCADVGYRRIRTHTTNEHRAMLLLNIQMGFDVVGTTAVPGREPKIVLERQLP